MVSVPPRVSSCDAFDWLDLRAAMRRKVGLSRALRPRPANPTRTIIDAAGNDYLGLAKHRYVCEAAIEAVRQWGAGSTGSRLVSGTTELHAQLELELARFFGAEAALVFSSGYTANLGAVAALCGPDTVIVADRNNHASLIDGCRLSSGDVRTVKHDSPNDVAEALKSRTRSRALFITESVFSVDGDLADLAALGDVSRTNGAGMIIDDAHGFGVVGDGGRGAVATAGLAANPDVVTTITLSKALGTQGGAVFGSRRVIQHLVDCARSFLFDTGLAPACVGAALASLQIIQQEPERVANSRHNARRLFDAFTDAELTVREPAAAIVSLDAPSPEAALFWANACRKEGVTVGCFRPPSVPDRVSRIRLTSRADFTDADIDRIIDVVTSTAPTLLA